MRGGEGADALDGQGSAGAEDHQGAKDARHGLGFAMAVGVGGVGGDGGEFEAGPDEEGRNDVEEGLETVGNEGVGMADEAGGDLGGAEHGVEAHAREGEMGARFELASGGTHDCLVRLGLTK